MKKIGYIFLVFLGILLGYSLFLKLRPLKKTVFYTNDERIEEFVYDAKKYPIVLVGSSLSGAFELNKQLFDQPYFNLYLPVTGACTGIEVIKRSHKIPKQLFIEINHFDRGTDSALLNSIFGQPLYTLKQHLPFLMKKNHLLSNIVDRVKAPQNNVINSQAPPPLLYDQLLKDAQKEWNKRPDMMRFNKQFLSLKAILETFSKQGCAIYFYEMPMDKSLYESALLTHQRHCFQQLADKNGYKFIKTDTSRLYHTGDGVHILKGDAGIYIKYFQSNIPK